GVTVPGLCHGVLTRLSALARWALAHRRRGPQPMMLIDSRTVPRLLGRVMRPKAYLVVWTDLTIIGIARRMINLAETIADEGLLEAHLLPGLCPSLFQRRRAVPSGVAVGPLEGAEQRIGPLLRAREGLILDPEAVPDMVHHGIPAEVVQAVARLLLVPGE